MPVVEKKLQLSVRVRPHIVKRLRKIADHKGQDMAEYMRLAILRAIEADERRGNHNGA